MQFYHRYHSFDTVTIASIVLFTTSSASIPSDTNTK